MTTGQRIAAKRKEHALSQEGLGEALGVSRQSIYKWESDTSLPEIDKLIALSRLFGVSVGWLLGVEDSPSQAEEPLSETQLRMVEELLHRYQQPSQPDLSPEQQVQVDQLVSKRLAEKEKSPWDKWSVRILFGMCGAIIASVFTINAKVDNFRQEYSGLSNSMQTITSSVNRQIDSLTGRVEEILKAQNSLTADYSAYPLSSDLAENTITFQLRTVPKSYTPGMEVIFLADCGREPLQVAGELGDGQAFTAQLTCPLTDAITLSAVFVTGDIRQTQILDSFVGLYSQSLPNMSLQFGDLFLFLEQGDDGAFLLPDTEGFVSWHSSAGMSGLVPEQSVPADIQVGLFQNRSLVCWLEQVADNTGEQPTSYHLSQRTLEAEEGDTIEFAALVTDSYGRRFICQDVGFIVSGGKLEHPDLVQLSSNPADWNF